MIVDLPTEEARLKILESNLKGETLDADVDLKEIAKKTSVYSGSDLKNVCVAVALARVKETLFEEHMGADKTLEGIQEKMNQIDDWGEFLAEKTPGAKSSSALKSLTNAQFDIGLKECPPSLSDEMSTLVELRKWDAKYGDTLSKRKDFHKGYGFALHTKKEKLHD
jgi:SpoVK/Ycf46/Vps4 family AAA+-type ATPase